MFKRTTMAAAVLAAWGAGWLLPEEAAAQGQQLDRVEITGSSIRRTDAETALPVTVIRPEDLAKQGITTAEQAMSRISANQSSFGTSSAVGGTTGGKAEVDLRGLSGPTDDYANKTLVLLNGRRLATHPFDAAAVDLNTIPLAAVERIEVLRDGASSLYGTDAIGGVVNFILRRDFKGVEVSLEHQKAQRRGGGDSTRFSFVGGMGDLDEQGVNVLATIDYRKQNVLRAADRGFADSGIVDSVNAGTSGSSFPGDVGGFEPSLPGGCNPPSSVPSDDGTSCRYDFSRDVDLIPRNEQFSALLRGTAKVAPEHTVTGEYLYSQNRTQVQVAPAPTTMLIPTTSPFYPAGAPVDVIPDIRNPGAEVPGNTVNWRMVPGGKRTSSNKTTSQRGLFELNGALSNWEYRAAAGVAASRSTEYVRGGYLNEAIVQDGIWDGLVNPFGPQTDAGAAVMAAAQVNEPTRIGRAKTYFVDARATTDLVQLPAGPLAAAFGVERRRENAKYETTAITGELQSLGLDPDDDNAGSRDVTALYTELNIPVFTGFEVNLSGRYDHYSDFGNTFNPKLGIRYQPIRELLVRGSINTGFRAPTLYDIYQPASLTFTSDNYDDPLLCPGGVAVPGASAGTVCAQQTLARSAGPAATGAGLSALDPEESRTATIGLVFSPTTTSSVAFDYWQIKVKNLISAVPEQAIFADPTGYASKFVRCSQLPASGPGISRDDVDVCLNFPRFDPIAYIDQPVENLGEMKTSGIDLAAAWRTTAGPAGTFALGIDGTYVLSYKYQQVKGSEFIQAVGRYTDNAPIFRWQHALTGGWSLGPWGVTLVQRFKSGYTDQDEVRKVSSYTVYDASLSWTGIKGMTLTAGVLNLLDKDPPLSTQVTTFQRGYDPRFASPLGRTFLVRAAYRF